MWGTTVKIPPFPFIDISQGVRIGFCIAEYAVLAKTIGIPAVRTPYRPDGI